MQFLKKTFTYLRLWYERAFNYPLYWKLRLSIQKRGGVIKLLKIIYLRRLEAKKNSDSGIGLDGNCCIIDAPIRMVHGLSNITIARNVHIGKGVEIFQNVTIAEADKTKTTHIEDYASLGTGCVILRNVRIGHHAKIGANAVVLCDVPPFATAVGNPARIIVK